MTMTDTTTDDDLRCGASTPNGECRNIGTYADGCCSAHTGRTTSPLRETHKALVEDDDTICSGCGRRFPTEEGVEYADHDCPKKTSRPKKAAKKAKAGGKKAKDVSLQEYRDFFENFGPKDLLALLIGAAIGTMNGHDPLQAMTIATAVAGGGALDAARKKRSSRFSPDHLRYLRHHAEAFLIGFVPTVIYIFVFHGDAVNAPGWYYNILDQIWHVFGLHNGGAH